MNSVNVSGGAFELMTGRPWTWGLSMYRDKEAFKIERRDGRYHFEIGGKQYSAKSISPHITDIQTVRN